MNDTVRKILDDIDMALLDPHNAELWQILTSFRGPDSDDQGLKKCFTETIRARALPKCLEYSIKHNGIAEAGFLLSKDSPEKTDRRFHYGLGEGRKEIQFHFYLHAQMAFEALELDMFAPNK